MPIIFQGSGGLVHSIDDKSAAGTLQLATLNTGGDEFTYEQYNTIITGLGIATAGNYQFLHTIGNDIYVYVFGDRIGEVIVHGLSFPKSCTGNGNNQHGFELLLQWYNENKLSANKSPIRVTIGSSTSFDGFAVSLAGNVKDAATRVIQFQLTLSLLPDAIVA